MSRRVVHKFPIPDAQGISLELPPTSKVAHFGIQREQFCVWIDRPVGVGQATQPIVLDLIVVGTGQQTPHAFDWAHVGTFQSNDGNFVFHLYQRIAL